MPCICYEDWNPRAAALETVEVANQIISEYAEAGFSLTLRQLYYQFVARDYLPNNERSYNMLGQVISKARRAGLVDWYTIEDRTRFLRDAPHWDSPASIVNACAQQFRIDRWAMQPYRMEVWIEKDALIGVIEGVCDKWYLPHFSCRGYTSDSEMWRAAQRIKSRNQRTIILHLGDHDPSGVDMTRDIEERLRLFSYPGRLDVIRIALTMDQVEEYNPPPNPAKLTDARARGYIAEYGSSSWELDALDPRTLADLIRKYVDEYLDADQWDAAVEIEIDGKNKLAEVVEQLESE